MGSVDLPPFLREKMKQKVQQPTQEPVAETSDSLPPFLKKKEEGVGGNGLNQSSQSQSNLPAQSQSVSNGQPQQQNQSGIPMADVNNIQNLISQQNKKLQPSDEGTAIYSQMAKGHKLDNAITQMATRNANAQYGVDYLKKNIKQQIDDGKLVPIEQQDGSFIFKQGTQDIGESFSNALTQSHQQDLENKYLFTLPKDQAIEYLNRTKINPEIGIVHDVETKNALGGFGEAIGVPSVSSTGAIPTGLGKIGAFLGENADLLMKGTVGTLAGASTGLTGGESFGTFLTMAKDLASSGYSQTLKQNYYLLKQQHPEMSDSEAFDKAHNIAMGGELSNLATGAILSKATTAKLPKSEVQPTGVINGVKSSFKHALKSAPKVIGSQVGATAATDVYGDIEGADKSFNDVLNDVGDAAKSMAVMHFGLWGLSEPTRIPSYIRPQIENYVASAPRQQVADFYSTAESNGVVPEGTSANVASKLSQFDEQKKVVDNLPIPEENKAAIAGKLIQKQKLQEQKEQLAGHGKAFQSRIDEIDQQIKDIDNSINKMYSAKNVFDVELQDQEKQQKTRDESIEKAQKKLNLPTQPNLYLSDEAQGVIDKINNGENILNSDLDLLSNELYGRYKTLSQTKDDLNRSYTREQYNNALNDLGNKIDVLETHKNAQAENEDFIKVDKNKFNNTKPTTNELQLQKEKEIPKVSEETGITATPKATNITEAKTVENGKVTATTKEEPKEEPKAEVIQPKANEGVEGGSKSETQQTLDNAEYTPRSSKNVIIRLPIDKVLKLQESGQEIKRGGKYDADFRINKIKDFYKEKPKKLEASLLRLNKDNSLGIDGRHRLIAAKELGATHSWFEIKGSDEAKLRDLLNEPKANEPKANEPITTGNQEKELTQDEIDKLAEITDADKEKMGNLFKQHSEELQKEHPIEPELTPNKEEELTQNKEVLPNKESNKENVVNLQHELPHTLSSEEKRGVEEAGNVAKTISNVVDGVHATGTKTESGIEELRQAESNEIEKSAKENGVWIDDPFKTFGNKPHTIGTEANVYLNKDGKAVTKLNSAVKYDTWQDYLNSIAIHNTLFPHEKYTLKGFTDLSGDLTAVVEQPVIRGKAASFDEVKSDMQKRGFEHIPENENPETPYDFINKKTGVIISDLHGENVIKDKNGNLRYIDTVIRKESNTNVTNGFTSSETINNGYRDIKAKLGEKKAKKYFEQVDRLINPNENEIVEYRTNGVVTKEGDKYTFHALSDMDLKNWRIGFKGDVTDQFKKTSSNKKFITHTGEEVSGKRLQDALNKVADDIAENKKAIRKEDKYASHVTEKQKDDMLAKGLQYAEEVRRGEHLDNLSVQQRIDYELTGKSIPIINDKQAENKSPQTKETENTKPSILGSDVDFGKNLENNSWTKTSEEHQADVEKNIKESKKTLLIGTEKDHEKTTYEDALKEGKISKKFYDKNRWNGLTQKQEIQMLTSAAKTNHEFQVKRAIKNGKYQEAISKGEMTPERAKQIIESAGLEVPKDILEKANTENNITQTKPINTEQNAIQEQGKGEVKPTQIGKADVSEHATDTKTEKGLENGTKASRLTDEGKAEAKDLGKYIADNKQTRIVSSDVERAKQTADVAAKEAEKISGKKVKTETNPLLSTWNIGEYDGKPDGSFDEKAWTMKPDEAPKGGESFNDFKNRMEDAYKYVKSLPEDAHVITHSKVMRAFDALEDTKGKWTDETTKKFLEEEKPQLNITDNKNIFDALDKTEERKTKTGIEKSKTRVEQKFGDLGKQARYIHDNFDAILKQLNIKKIC